VSCTCVVGLQWGDEAKGKIVDLLTDQHELVVRYQGGANAGHTVVYDGKKFKFSLVPSGILHEHVTAVVANGVVVDPIAFLNEVAALEKEGVACRGRLWLSNRAHVIMPYHRKQEELNEAAAGKTAIGTTLRGIGPCYSDKMSRVWGIRIGDLIQPQKLRAKLEAILPAKNAMLAALAVERFEPLDLEEVFDEYRQLGERLKPYVTDTTQLLHEALAAGKSLLFEGAQGTLLDVDHGTYPFVTSSNSSACGLWPGCGVPARRVDRFIGVLKAYTTRVGGGPFPTELHDEIGQLIRDTGREYGTVTGRPRRVGWFDAVLARYSARICGVDGLAVMLLDVLSELDELAICVGYVHRGKRIETVPADCDELAACQPIYRTLPGWRCDISEARTPADLPSQARAYLAEIANLVGAPIRIVSVGPEREATIWVEGEL